MISFIFSGVSMSSVSSKTSPVSHPELASEGAERGTSPLPLTPPRRSRCGPIEPEALAGGWAAEPRTAGAALDEDSLSALLFFGSPRSAPSSCGRATAVFAGTVALAKGGKALVNPALEPSPRLRSQGLKAASHGGSRSAAELRAIEFCTMLGGT